MTPLADGEDWGPDLGEHAASTGLTPSLEHREPWLVTGEGSAVRSGVRSGVPPASLALYARWWQLEAWLRDLLYVELRAMHGTRWGEVVRQAMGRQSVDATYTHMHGADTGNPLAYLDYSQIVEVISTKWESLGYALLPRKAWEGRQEELKRIRHRIGHMRRPHEDDLGRLEQTLRDLERGTFVALASYNDTRFPDPEVYSDAVTRGWVLGEHEDAMRLVNHARRQYDTRLAVRASSRPWVERGSLAGHGAGSLWHADFFVSGRTVNAARLWYDTDLNGIRDLLVHMRCHGPHHIGFTFSGADADTAVADAIGTAFDAVLMHLDPWTTFVADEAYDEWKLSVRDIDYRVLVDSGWLIVDSTTLPISNFGSGGSVRTNPGW